MLNYRILQDSFDERTPDLSHFKPFPDIELNIPMQMLVSVGTRKLHNSDSPKHFKIK